LACSSDWSSLPLSSGASDTFAVAAAMPTNITEPPELPAALSTRCSVMESGTTEAEATEKPSIQAELEQQTGRFRV
ncbi:MAG: hypothetical protein SVX28_12270, partial [Pseudomonadota bacterium]|nr:hypothetical protein [Pseudomonadota bacterium]